jgi:hypothetical protein
MRYRVHQTCAPAGPISVIRLAVIRTISAPVTVAAAASYPAGKRGNCPDGDPSPGLSQGLEQAGDEQQSGGHSEAHDDGR